MGSTENLLVCNQTVIATTNVEPDDTLVNGSSQFVAALTLTNRTAGTYDVLLQHSPDGSNWTTLATFATLSANGHQLVQVSAGVLPRLRANVTVTSGPGNANVEVRLWFDPSR